MFHIIKLITIEFFKNWEKIQNINFKKLSFIICNIIEFELYHILNLNK